MGRSWWDECGNTPHLPTTTFTQKRLALDYEFSVIYLVKSPSHKQNVAKKNIYITEGTVHSTFVLYCNTDHNRSAVISIALIK